jgi:pimeloyl-ACP methyl ester carboxylesterase
VFEANEVDLHGHRVIYREAGEGPAVVLVHGMLNSSRHFRRVALALADRYRVIAPDLIGHGASATPRGDYSLGAHASVIRDLLVTIGVERASLVGHSLGGGIAMVFFWQFPQRTERLALISSGGLGREVSPLLRSAALPGAAGLLAVAAHARLLDAADRAGEALRARGRDEGTQLQAIARALRPLQGRAAQEAFLLTLRAVIDRHGQRVSAADRLHLLRSVPTLIVWGERDRTIPLAHGRAAHAAVPGSTFVTLPGAAHFPHLEDPGGVAGALREFLAATAPTPIADADWRRVLRP